MPRLCMITVPGLTVASDWVPVHARLLDDFPQVTDVLATTMPGTLLIVYEGDANVDAWLQGISDQLLSRRMGAKTAPRTRTRSRASVRASAGTGVPGARPCDFAAAMRQDTGRSGYRRPKRSEVRVEPVNPNSKGTA